MYFSTRKILYSSHNRFAHVRSFHQRIFFSPGYDKLIILFYTVFSLLYKSLNYKSTSSTIERVVVWLLGVGDGGDGDGERARLVLPRGGT
jgi:hypothetical protein